MKSRAPSGVDRPLPWLRLNCDFVNSPRVQRLTEPLQRRYICLLCLAGQRHLPTDDDDMVAFALRLSRAETRETKATLLAATLISPDWMPTSFEKYARPSDHDGSVRTRRWRAKRAARSDSEMKRHSDVTVTANGTERDGTGRDVRNGRRKRTETAHAAARANGEEILREKINSSFKLPSPIPRSGRQNNSFDRVLDQVERAIVQGQTSPDDVEGLRKVTGRSERQVLTAVTQLRDRGRIH